MCSYQEIIHAPQYTRLNASWARPRFRGECTWQIDAHISDQPSTWITVRTYNGKAKVEFVQGPESLDTDQLEELVKMCRDLEERNKELKEMDDEQA